MSDTDRTAYEAGWRDAVLNMRIQTSKQKGVTAAERVCRTPAFVAKAYANFLRRRARTTGRLTAGGVTVVLPDWARDT